MAYIKVEVDLSNFDDQEIAEELQYRGYLVAKSGAVDMQSQIYKAVERLYHKKRMGQDYEKELSEIIDLTIDKII